MVEVFAAIVLFELLGGCVKMEGGLTSGPDDEKVFIGSSANSCTFTESLCGLCLSLVPTNLLWIHMIRINVLTVEQ